MKYTNAPSTRRFDSPTVLKVDAPFLGATVGAWDKAITGNIEATLVQVKKRAMGGAAKRDISQAVTSDVASSISRRLQAK